MTKPFSHTILHLAAVEFTAIKLLKPQLEALQERGFDIRVGCQPGPNGFDQTLEQFRPVNVDFPRRLDPVATLQASRRLVKVLSDMRPAAVHLHTPAVALPFRCIPHHFFPPGMKVFYTVHGFAHLWNTGKPKDIVLERIERTLAHRTDLMLFQSYEDFENVQVLHYRTHLEYLGNGVGDEWFAIPPMPPRNGRLKALFVGRLIGEKGIIDLLEALVNLPDVELTVVGAQLPSDRGGVAAQVAELVGKEALKGRVRCTGMISQEQLLKQMLSTDLVVLPSYREGVPRSLIEGMAAGRPLLATDTRGCRELISEGVNGFLVPVARPDLLAQAIRKFVSLSPEVFAAMGVASKERALASHHEQMIFDRLVSAYAGEDMHPRDA